MPSPRLSSKSVHHHAAVPRFFEKIYTRLVEQGSKDRRREEMIFDWAMRVAEMSAQWRATGRIRNCRYSPVEAC